VNVVSIGEILWDVFEDSEHLGGAPFNFAAHCHRLGNQVMFLSAVGGDGRGDAALKKAEELELPIEYVARVPHPTGTVTVQVDAAGVPTFTIHRPAAYDYLELDDDILDGIELFAPDWVYFGTLHQYTEGGHRATARLLEHLPDARRFYDVNLRPRSYTPDLVCGLLAGADVVKLNEDEARLICEWSGCGTDSIEAFCRTHADRFDWEAVCVTKGEHGCALLAKQEYVEVDGYPVQVADTVGSGDAFAAAFLTGLHAGWPAARLGQFANRLGALVASRRGAIPDWTPAEIE
jgi:fructokinase